MSKFVAIIVAVFAALCIAHPQFRQLKCSTPDGQLRAGNATARCHLIIKDLENESPGRPARENDGTFIEIVNGEERVYQDIVCPKAHTVFNAHIDQGHRSCFNFYTYQVTVFVVNPQKYPGEKTLERRGDEWYIWRSGKCLNSTATFTIGCKFDEPFRTQFASDNEIFARLAARRVV